MDLVLRPLTAGDTTAMSELMGRYHARRRGPEHFLWYYFETPVAAVATGAFEGDRLVGMFGLQRKPIHGGDGHIDQLCDLVVETDYRGHGLFRRLWEQACQYLDSGGPQCVIANPSGAAACVRKLGFEQLFQLDHLLLTAPPRAGEVRSPSQGKLFSLTLTGEAADWRFRSHPQFVYEFFGDSPEEEVVVKLFRDPEGLLYGDIVRYRLPRGGPLLAEACRHLFSQGCRVITCWALPHTPWRQPLLDLGFEARLQERFFCVRTTEPELRVPENWHLMSADTEHF